MSTQIGSIVESLGAALTLAFPAYSVIYGQPVENGIRVPTGSTIRVHYMQERGTYATSQMSGPVRVAPLIAVTLERQFTGTPDSLEAMQEAAELASDLRSEIEAWVMANAMGTATIPGVSGLWATDYTTTPARLPIGPGQSRESITIEISLNYVSTYGGR